MSQTSNITANGTTSLGALPAEKRLMTLLVSGTFGSGTLTPGYIDPVDGTTFRPFVTLSTPAALTADGEFSFELGSGVTAAVSLAGATNPVINVTVT